MSKNEKHVVDAEVEDFSLLNEPLNLADLLSKGSHFEISNDFDSMRNSEIYDDFNEGSNDDDDNDIDFQKTILSPWESKFDDLRAKMTKISDGIYKKIIKNGDKKFGSVRPINSRVVIEYNSYKELDVKPVDSTFLRGSKQLLNIGANEIVHGLETAILSMAKGEEAHFLISYEYLYGELGCPPRIPPKSDLLFVIVLIDFHDVGDVNATDNINQEDRNKFSIVFPKVEEVHKKGKDFFRLRNYEYAIRTFYKAIQALEHCQLGDADDEEKQRIFLKMLYLNLAICYHKKDIPKKVCIMLNSLRRIDEKAYYRNVKALYFEGQALFKLSEYNRAKICLNKAQRIEPENQEINNALRTLAEAETKHKKFERELCERTFGIMKATKKQLENKKDGVCEEIKKTLEEFKHDNNCTEMKFPQGLTNCECRAVEEIIKEINLKLIKTSFGNKIIVKD